MSSPIRHFTVGLSHFLRDECGQDMIEYALMAGAVAVAAGAIMPPVSNTVADIFIKVATLARRASGNTATPTTN